MKNYEKEEKRFKGAYKDARKDRGKKSHLS